MDLKETETQWEWGVQQPDRDFAEAGLDSGRRTGSKRRKIIIYKGRERPIGVCS